MSRILGIDLGTTNTVVALVDELGGVRALPDETGSRLIPSVVSMHPNGQVLAGRRARDRRVIDPQNTVFSVKRLIGLPFADPEASRAIPRLPFSCVQTAKGGIAVRTRGGDFEIPEVSALVLREAKRIAEQATGETFTRAVITVPANFNDLQRSATRMAARIAGLDAIRILNEPTAAALAYGLATGERERVVIYDFGGGTFDVTVLELAGSVFEVVSTAGDMFLGGDDVDTALADVLAAQFLALHRIDLRADAGNRAKLLEAAEQAKKDLSIMQMVDVHLPEVAYGVGGAPIDLFVRITQPQFEQLIAPLVERTIEVTDKALRAANLTPTQIDNVVLVGGSTRLPIVRRRVQQMFGRAPLATMDPDLVVALGAAVQGRALAADVDDLPALEPAPPGAPSKRPPPPPPRARKSMEPPPPPDLVAPSAAAPPPLLVDVTPLSLQLETVGGICEVVIPRNAAIPCEETREFTTAADGQTGVLLRVCQGESRRFGENQSLGELRIDGLPAKARGQVRLAVTFRVDTDGTVGVEAEDRASGQRARATLARLGAIDDAAVDALRARHEGLGGAG